MTHKPPYLVSAEDSLVELSDFPRMDSGSPRPLILVSETELTLSYFNFNAPDYDYDEDDGEPVTVVKFQGTTCHYLGPPNDETLNGHPLYERGLRWYTVCEVVNSSWISQLEIMNRVHPRHDPQRFRALRHFIFTFHDSTFECVAMGYQVEVTHAGP